MRTKVLAAAFLLLFTNTIYGQETANKDQLFNNINSGQQLGQQVSQQPAPPFDKAAVGFGIGQIFGGIGANVVVYPQKNFGLFGGAGYALAGMGYNLGVKIRLGSDKTFRSVVPYLMGMYGYNAAIMVSNMTELNKIFYGPTIGGGFDIRSKKMPDKKSYWSMGLYIPIRSSEVSSYIDDLKTNHNVDFSNNLIPLTFSFGYHFILN